MPLFLALPSQAQLRHANEALRQEVAKHRQTLAVLEEAEARFHHAFDYAAIGMALEPVLKTLKSPKMGLKPAFG
jgi:C4-dicarboxylate-specific signal transduction histidine kinase